MIYLDEPGERLGFNRAVAHRRRERDVAVLVDLRQLGRFEPGLSRAKLPDIFPVTYDVLGLSLHTKLLAYPFKPMADCVCKLSQKNPSCDTERNVRQLFRTWFVAHVLNMRRVLASRRIFG